MAIGLDSGSPAATSRTEAPLEKVNTGTNTGERANTPRTDCGPQSIPAATGGGAGGTRRVLEGTQPPFCLGNLQAERFILGQGRSGRGCARWSDFANRVELRSIGWRPGAPGDANACCNQQ